MALDEQNVQMRLAALEARAGAGLKDANGWYYEPLPSGRASWRQRWLGVALGAAVAQLMVSAAALPVGVANLGQVDVVGLAWRLPANAWAVSCGVPGTEATTTLSVSMGTTDGTNLNTKAATGDVWVLLEQR